MLHVKVAASCSIPAVSSHENEEARRFPPAITIVVTSLHMCVWQGGTRRRREVSFALWCNNRGTSSMVMLHPLMAMKSRASYWLRIKPGRSANANDGTLSNLPLLFDRWIRIYVNCLKAMQWRNKFFFFFKNCLKWENVLNLKKSPLECDLCRTHDSLKIGLWRHLVVACVNYREETNRLVIKVKLLHY